MNPVTIGSSRSRPASATSRARSSGSALMRATCSRQGRSPSPAAPHAGVNCSGWNVWNPRSSDTVRPCTWGRTVAPSAWAAAHRSSSRFHEVGSALFWLSAKVTGRPMASDSRRIQSISRSGAARSSPSGAGGRQLEHAGAELAEHPPDAEQLVLGGERAGHRLAVDGAVGERAAGREAEGPGLDARPDDGGHGLDVLGRGGLVAWRRARPSRSPARRRAGPACRGPSRATVGSRASRNSGKLSQLHSMPAERAAPGMSSTPSIRPMSHSCRSAATGAKPTPQLPITDGGDAVPAGRREQLVPGGLAVVVGVDVDEARRDERAVGVDLPACPCRRPRRPR